MSPMHCPLLEAGERCRVFRQEGPGCQGREFQAPLQYNKGTEERGWSDQGVLAGSQAGTSAWKAGGQRLLT